MSDATKINIQSMIFTKTSIHTYLQSVVSTVPVEECDRHHNMKKHSRARLPIRNLCQDCQQYIVTTNPNIITYPAFGQES